MTKPLIVAIFASIFTTSLAAQPGKLIKNVKLPVPGNGVGVAVDCNGVVYYTHVTPQIHRMDKNGKNLGSFSTGRVVLNELAYDAKRNVLWGCEYRSRPIRIFKVDVATKKTTLAFVTKTISLGTFRDGLALDAAKDSLYVAGDVSSTIDEYKVTGTFIRTLTPKNARGGTLGAISGVTVGRGDLLYLGQNGRRQIVQVRKSDGKFLKVFASPGGARDEGLECDPINFAPKLALWSREFNSPGFVSVIELKPGTCSCGGRQNDPPRFVGPTPRCDSTINAAIGKPLRVTIRVTDPQPSQRITLSVAGAPPGATFAPSLPVTGAAGAAVQTVMTWTPSTSGQFTSTFTAKDNDASFPRSTTCKFNFSACAVAAWSLYGAGHPGTKGIPTMAMSAAPKVGTTPRLIVGNSANTASHGCLLIGPARQNLKTIYGGTLLVRSTVVLPFAIPRTTLPVPIPISSALSQCGLRVYMQAIEFDRGASRALSFSRGVQLTLGR